MIKATRFLMLAVAFFAVLVCSGSCSDDWFHLGPGKG